MKLKSGDILTRIWDATTYEVVDVLSNGIVVKDIPHVTKYFFIPNPDLPCYSLDLMFPSQKCMLGSDLPEFHDER